MSLSFKVFRHTERPGACRIRVEKTIEHEDHADGGARCPRSSDWLTAGPQQQPAGGLHPALRPGSSSPPAHYTVVARRYRPQRFEDVVGQDHVVQALRNAIRLNRLAQAYLFCGTRGVGKTSMARIFAKCLNCVQGPTESPARSATSASRSPPGKTST